MFLLKFATNSHRELSHAAFRRLRRLPLPNIQGFSVIAKHTRILPKLSPQPNFFVASHPPAIVYRFQAQSHNQVTLGASLCCQGGGARQPPGMPDLLFHQTQHRRYRLGNLICTDPFGTVVTGALIPAAAPLPEPGNFEVSKSL
jgi:hypothetical protein